MTSPKNRQKSPSEMNIEHHRQEGNWARCLELAQQCTGTEQAKLQTFLVGEAKLELFMEEVSKKFPYDCSIKDIDRSDLEEAKVQLKKCLDGQTDSVLVMDANLLLAKAYFISGSFQEALSYIRQTCIDSIDNVDKTLPLRVMKLIAESFAIKAMSMEKIMPNRRKTICLANSYDLLDFAGNTTKKTPVVNGRLSSSNVAKLNSFSNESQQHDYETYKAIVELLNRAANCAILFAQKKASPYPPLGYVLDSSLLRTHHVHLNQGFGRPYIQEAVDYCRKIMNYCETSSTLHIRQYLSKELAELLLKSVCRGQWKKPELFHSKSSSSPACYIGSSLFMPTEYEEEVLLLLMISEALTSRNVLLDRNADYDESRKQSLNNVLLVQDLFTIALIPLRCYYLDFYERALKYSYEVKHTWYQFALTLMESKKNPLRSMLSLKEVSRIDPVDPVPNLIAAKLCMLELHDYPEALRLITDSLQRYQTYEKNKIGSGNNAKYRDYSHLVSSSVLINNYEVYAQHNLLYQIHLMMGVAHALIFETDSKMDKELRTKHLNESINHLNKAIEYDKFGNNHLPYFHIALHMAYQRALKEALKYVRVSLMLNNGHLPSIQLLILLLAGLKKYDEAHELCLSTLKEYPSHLMLLYIKVRL